MTAPVAVAASTDAAAALEAAEGFLVRSPVHNSLLLGLLLERAAAPLPGRYWWAQQHGDVTGFVFQSPPHFRALVAPADRAVLDALVERIAADVPDLPGIMGDATSAAAFAGRWAERRGTPVVPVEAQRVYRLGRLDPPPGVAGRLRRAGEADAGALLGWLKGFLAETGVHPLNPAELLQRHLARGLWLWETEAGEPVSMAVATPAAAGMSRIGFVYTPPEHRRCGYAAACVAAVSERVQGDGLDCILNTQLQNPTSNAVYRRLGFEPVVEVLIYRFG